MDFAKIADEIAQDEQIATVPIENKNGDPYLASDGSQSTISVVGSESTRVQHAKDVQTRRLLRSTRRKLEPKDLRENRIEIAAAAVVEWHGWEMNGEAWPCTPENAKKLLGAEHILVQVEEAVSRHSTFFTSSSPTS